MGRTERKEGVRFRGDFLIAGEGYLRGSSDEEILFAVAPWQGIPQLLPKSLSRAWAAPAPAEAPGPVPKPFKAPMVTVPHFNRGRSTTEISEEKKWEKGQFSKERERGRERGKER